MTSYYCHECRRRVSVNNALQCNNCRGEFVEEVGEEEAEQLDDEHPMDGEVDEEEDGGHHRQGFYVRQNDDGSGGTIVFEGVNPLMALLTGRSPYDRIFGQVGQRLPAAGTSAVPWQPQPGNAELRHGASGSRNAGEADQNDSLGGFLGQLLANLAQGAAEGGGASGRGARLTFHFGGDGGGGGGSGGLFQTIHGNPNDYAWGDGGIDTIVTQLLNQFEGNQEQGVSQEDLTRLPTTEVNDKQVENTAQCTTCMETFTKGEKVVQLDCQHIFHRPCIVPWLVKHNTCPICRQTIDPKNWGPEPRITDIDELD